MLVKTSMLLLALSANSLALPSLAFRQSSALTCNTAFNAISAQAWVDGMNPGWNLGNTLDALPTEGSWNNPPVDFSTFDDVKAAGFKGVRLPITWTNHFTSSSPTWDVDDVWLQRVSDVVDAVLSRELYALVNVHHDASDWANIAADGANYTMIEEKFYRLWFQIGTKLGCKSEKLAFEPINELPGTNQDQYDESNKLQCIFVTALKDSGGFNAQRVVTFTGPQENSDLTSEFFQLPSDFANPWALQYHYYSPYDFVFSAWGKTIWGSDADKSAMEADIANIRNNFTDVPLIIGEWDASVTNTETAARWKYNDFLVRTAAKYNTATVIWDNGADQLDRAAHKFRDQSAIDIIIDAKNGEINSLADSTTDTSATTQDTSAYIFHRAGQPLTDQTRPYLFTGNTLTSIKSTAGALIEGTDYTVSANTITYTAALLEKYITTNTTPGEIATFTLHFSAGADLTATLVQWDVPHLSSSSQPAASATSDIAIPITWAGIAQVASVKAVTASGGYLVDDFTAYFGPLADHRTTYSSQWNFDAENVIITAGAVAAVVAAGETTTFTFEFYPRVPGNAVNFNVTV